MLPPLENPFYYLENFQRATAWIGEHYDGLLTDEERTFITHFGTLPQASRALLVRMVMRKGTRFRAGKLRYEEIGCTREAARPLTMLGWVDERQVLTLEQAFSLMTKTEIVDAFRDRLPRQAARKSEQLEALRAHFPEARTFDAWHAAGDYVYQLRIDALCERLRLLFFGNLHQDWTEFVLSDLSIYRYEKVEFSPASQGFR